MTREQLLVLPQGTTLHHKTAKNADGTPVRCRITGKPRLWKRRPNYFEVPVKHGLRNSFRLTPQNIGEWELPA